MLTCLFYTCYDRHLIHICYVGHCSDTHDLIGYLILLLTALNIVLLYFVCYFCLILVYIFIICVHVICTCTFPFSYTLIGSLPDHLEFARSDIGCFISFQVFVEIVCFTRTRSFSLLDLVFLSSFVSLWFL